MAWPVVVAGTCHLDDVDTPLGARRGLQGGSAVYFALAAARHVSVTLAGAVGQDADSSVRKLLSRHPVDLRLLTVSQLPSYRWRVRHDPSTGAAADDSPSQRSADDDWAPWLDAAAVAAPVLFVASLRPQLQLDVLRQSRARLIGADTMTAHIAADPAAFDAVLESADILFVNHHELSALLPGGAPDRLRAARSLLGRGRLRAVVLKLGSRGAVCVTAHGLVEQRTSPPRRVVDPTGAGDALAGGFLGACAAAERDDEAFFAAALAAGMRAAAQAISAFGCAGLGAPAPA